MLRYGDFAGNALLETPDGPVPVTYTLTVTEEDGRQWITGQLKYSNDPEFLQRLWSLRNQKLTLRLQDGPVLTVRVRSDQGTFIADQLPTPNEE